LVGAELIDTIGAVGTIPAVVGFGIVVIFIICLTSSLLELLY
jgi:hypothetical protein